MIAFLLALMLWANERIYSGYLSYADLQAVVEAKGWQGTQDFEVLLAVPDCSLLARQGWLITPNGTYSAVIVDCGTAEDKVQMTERNLLADQNKHRLTHQYAWLVIR